MNKFEQVFSDGHQMSQAGGGVEGSEVNKSEQVSSDDHQMSLPGGTCTVRSHVWGVPVQ